MATQKVVPETKQAVCEQASARPLRTYRPQVDISETADAIRVWADMPGVDASSLEVHLDRGALTISGQVVADETAGLTPRYREYEVGNFVEGLSVSDDIDIEAIRATISDGVLDLELPKLERARPRRIEVSAV